MAGEFQHIDDDGYRVTLGPADDPRGDFFISMQDEQGNKWSLLYDQEYNIIDEQTKG